MLSVRLPSHLEQELSMLAKQENRTKTDIVKEAIVFFLKNIKANKKETSYTLGRDLFGVYEGESDLSSNYKQKLSTILHEKHDH